MPTASLVEVLDAIVGPMHVRVATPADALAGIEPRVIVEPADEKQVASVLRCANDSGFAVIPTGGGTKLNWGNPPRAADCVLSLRRLNHVVEHAWADLTVTVEAGCTVAQLQSTLAGHGQRLAVDPLWPDRATVGGILATNDSGALRLAFGGLRDLIIGVTLALADGTIASSGGKVVKNVAGYDLPKLATGALGTLGVITRAVFRLHPLPRNSRTLTILAADAQVAMLAISGARLALTAMQIRAGAGSNPEVDILLEGTEEGIAAQEATIRALVGPAEVHTGSPAVWNARQELWSGAGTIVKFSVLPSEVMKAWKSLAKFAQGGWSAVVQATGLGYARLQGDIDIQGLRTDIGTVIAFNQSKIDAWGDVGDALPLMRTVKAQFDPKSTLNPGRYAGDI